MFTKDEWTQKELSFARTPLLAQFSFSFCPDFAEPLRTGTAGRPPPASKQGTHRNPSRKAPGADASAG